MELKNGYDRTRNPETNHYRRMTVYEAKRLTPGSRVPFLATDGTARELTINGKPKTWKTRPGHVRVPIKYGLYEYGYAEHVNDPGSPADPVSLLLVRTDTPN